MGGESTVSRSKQIGTEGETAVVRFLADNGWPHAERRALRGTNDYGDVTGTPALCWEVKAGHAAEACQDADLRQWQDQTDAETKHSRADLGILVIKRKGKGTPNVGQWWAWMRVEDLAGLLLPDTQVDEAAPTAWVRMTLKEAVRFLHWAGYGTPTEQEHFAHHERIAQ